MICIFTGIGVVAVMYEDLEPIASLKFGQIVDCESRKGVERMSAAVSDLARRGHSHPESGPMISARVDVALETSGQVCRGLYDTWLQLILQRNLGRLTREDTNFIMERVNACSEARVNNIGHMLGSLNARSTQWALNRARMGMESVASGIGRELEIKLREQVAFPKREVVPPPDLRFTAFLRAFGENWLTKMSGPLTVPFTLAALFVPAYLKPIFAGLAITSGVFASYQVWRNARASGNRP